MDKMDLEKIGYFLYMQQMEGGCDYSFIRGLKQIVYGAC